MVPVSVKEDLTPWSLILRTVPRDGRLYQSDSTQPIALVLAAMFIVMVAAGAGESARHGAHTGDVAFGSFAIVLGAIGFVWAVARMGRLGVWATDQGITVRNGLRSYFFPWDTIDSFKSGTEMADLTTREMLASPVLQHYVILKGGMHRVMAGLNATRFNSARSRAKVRELLDGLEAERLRHVSLS